MIKTDFTHSGFWFWTPSAGCEGTKAWEVRRGLRVRIGIQSLCCTEPLKAVKLLQGQMQTRRGERSEGCVGNTYRNLKLFPPLGESVVSLRSASSQRRIVSSLEKRPHTRNKNSLLLIFCSLLFRRGRCWEADHRYGKRQPWRVRLSGKFSHHILVWWSTAGKRQQSDNSVPHHKMAKTPLRKEESLYFPSLSNIFAHKRHEACWLMLY